jgi:hypothetical protein|uniref:Uncharacterized protein n=1 Tax=viral metagenome TaxID=1070528 RepID=A0A6C0ENT2_9ZZZZ
MKVPITNVLHRGAPFFSFIIGLGIAVLLFHRDYGVMKTLAIPIKEATERVIKVDGKCYRYRVEDAQCEIPSSS